MLIVYSQKYHKKQTFVLDKIIEKHKKKLCF